MDHAALPQRIGTNSTAFPAGGAAPVHDGRRNQQLGSYGEGIAAQYLTNLGYREVARNWRRGRDGELDLVMRDGATLVAVEVKTRRGIGYGHPLEAITAAKARRLRRLLRAWDREHRVQTAGASPTRMRIDAVGIVVSRDDAPRITHLRGIA